MLLCKNNDRCFREILKTITLLTGAGSFASLPESIYVKRIEEKIFLLVRKIHGILFF